MRTVTVQSRRGAGGPQLPLSHYRAARGPGLRAATAKALIATGITHWLAAASQATPHQKRTQPCKATDGKLGNEARAGRKAPESRSANRR